MRDLLTYHDVGGSLRRRGEFVQAPAPGMISETFESLTVTPSLGTNPDGLKAFRAAVHDPKYGYLQPQHALMAVEDLGGAAGRVITVTVKPDYYKQANNNGIAYAPQLPRAVRGVRVGQWVRFRPGFVSGKGGKFGVGVGWRNQWAPISTGGSSNNHSGSFRWMWRDWFRLSPYLYDANGTAGLGLATSPTIYDLGDFARHYLEFDVLLNTATVTAGPNVGSPPSPGSLGVDYFPDGVLVCRFGGAPNPAGPANGPSSGQVILEQYNRVLRKYADTLIPQMTWSWFRGGGDSTWDVGSGDNFIDLESYSIVELFA